MEGYIHSIETFGTVDGPGIRYVVFLQGCPMRCAYCHNPDTWNIKDAKMTKSVNDIIDQYERYKDFYTDGGITVTGGEPLVQIDFVTELFKQAKLKGIHTCLDTSGITFDVEFPITKESRLSDNQIVLLSKFDKLVSYTDLVMLDIKHIDNQEHIKLTTKENNNTLNFLRYLDKKKKPVWIRHVVVPGITLDEKSLLKLGRFLQDFSNIRYIDVLPYHTMGVEKYKKLGIPYRLEGVESATEKDAYYAREAILRGRRSIDNII